MNSPFAPNAIHRAVYATLTDQVDDALNCVSSNAVANDVVPEHLPDVFRIQSLARALNGSGLIENRAVLYHECCTITVNWVTQQVDTRLTRFGLVKIRHAHKTHCHEGAIRIDRLIPAGPPAPEINLFETIPHSWIKDRELVKRAADLWEQLPRSLAHLVNSVFWEAGRFHRFVMGPSSLQGHHLGWNGNFRHSVEVAERARDLGQGNPLVNASLLIAGGLLHDAAKADEYQFDREYSAFRLSDRGELVGHRDTLIEWIAIAREAGRGNISDELYLALLHMLNAASGAPKWLGLRKPRTLEAEILSMSDRLSGHADLHQRCAPESREVGFGQFHPHLGCRTYVSPREYAI